MDCAQCSADAVTEVLCSEGVACLCGFCASDWWAFHVTGDGYQRDELTGIGP